MLRTGTGEGAPSPGRKASLFDGRDSPHMGSFMSSERFRVASFYFQ
jgi:hypothetical protein